MVVSAGKLRKLRDSLGELRSSLCERRLESTVLRLLKVCESFIVLGPLLFLIHIYDLSKSISDKSIQILFADDTTFIITNHDDSEFRHKVN
jgi:hypothetical protein